MLQHRCISTYVFDPILISPDISKMNEVVRFCLLRYLCYMIPDYVNRYKFILLFLLQISLIDQFFCENIATLISTVTTWIWTSNLLHVRKTLYQMWQLFYNYFYSVFGRHHMELLYRTDWPHIDRNTCKTCSWSLGVTSEIHKRCDPTNKNDSIHRR